MKRLLLIGALFIGCSVLTESMFSYCEYGPATGETKKWSNNVQPYILLPIPESLKSDNLAKLWPLKQVCAGVDIHFITGHEKDLDMIVTAGFKFIRMDILWQATERTKGTYDWVSYHELTANLRKRGLAAIYILCYSNSLYETTVDSKDPQTGERQRDIASPQHNESLEAFAQWAAAAALHFRGSNIVWEIWNEPNVSYWRPGPDVKQYIALTRTTCKAIREVVPEASVIGPSTSQIPLPFLESCMAAGLLEDIDAVSVHPYRDYALAPESVGADYQELRELIKRYAPPEKKNMPVINSEWGYASATKGVSLEKQAAFSVRMHLANMLNGIPISIWYDWKNDGNSPTDFEHNCGLVTSDLKPKPVYIASRVMNFQLNGFSLLRRIDTKNEDDFVLLFKSDKGIYKISAWTIDQSHSIRIDTARPNVGGITGIDGMGNVIKLTAGQRWLELNLNELPQYITLPYSIGME